MTQTPASGPLALVTTPPMSSLSMATAGCCARAVTRNSDPTSARHAAAMVSSGFLVRGIFQSSVGCRKYHALRATGTSARFPFLRGGGVEPGAAGGVQGEAGD